MLGGMRKLSDAECGRLFRALLSYSAGADVGLINLQGREEVLFDVYSQQIDRDIAAYDGRCEQNRENAKKRSQAIGSDRKQSVAIGSETSQDKDKEKDKGKDKKGVDKNAHARFIPPTVEAVDEYCRSRGNRVNAQRFVDYYSANGWKVGKNPMKDWKAAVRTWEQRDDQPRAQSGGNPFMDLLREGVFDG